MEFESKVMKAIYYDNYVWGKHYEKIVLCEADKVEEVMREVRRRSSEIISVQPFDVDVMNKKETARVVKLFLENLEKEEEYVEKKELSHRLYEQTSDLLTKYEKKIDNGEGDGLFEDDLYTMLLKIHRNWEAITR